MNFRKGLLSTLTMGLLFTGILSMTSISQASEHSTGKYLKMNIPTYRQSGYAYRVGGIGKKENTLGLRMWKILEYNSNYTTPKNMYNGIYCLKMGVGFGASEESQKDIYTLYADMKNPKNSEDQNIIDTYKKDLPNVQNYNSIVWVLDHCYIPAAPNASEEEKNAAIAYKQELLDAAGISRSSDFYKQSIGNVNNLNDVTNDVIDIIQQIAIWYFTNNDEYHVDSIGSINVTKDESNNNYLTSLEELYGDNFEIHDEEIYKLYKYFIDNGIANKNTAPNTSVTNPIKLVDSTAKVTALDENYYIAGPYKIEQVLDKVYTLDGMLVGTDNAPISYTLLDSNKQETSKTLKELVGQEFYLKVSSTENIEKSVFKVVSKVKQNTITYWTKKGTNKVQPVAEVIPEEKVFEEETTLSLSNFDLALRKFITKINGKEVEINREPNITTEAVEKFKAGTAEAKTTVSKVHTKDPLTVNIGDTVIYTIRIYNEGDIDGFATEVTDYLPEGLTLKPNSTINTENGWTTSDGKTIVTTKLANQLIKKFDGTSFTTDNYKDLEIECLVNANASENTQSLKNVAEITDDADENGNEVIDRDSTPKNLTEEEKKNYNPGTSTKGWGYEDDDDYEELRILGKKFDLALRKFITEINGEKLLKADGTYLREPTIDLTPLKDNDANTTTANYRHPKDPIRVKVGDEVIYTLRIYNEGELDGYVSSVTDYLPPQLKFINDAFNAQYGWQIDKTGRIATSEFLSKEQDATENLLTAFDGKTLDYVELKIKCEVISTEKLDEVITNIAEITGFTDVQGKTVIDIDSQEKNVKLPSDENLPDYKGNESNKSVLSDADYFYKGGQDDDDFEKLILEEFDLALRKFITKVNETPITNRVPVFTNVKDNNGNYIYEHTKEPVEVESTDIVEYTLRIYNEGDIAGYAKEIKDNIPEGLEFIPSNDTNKEYRWIMLDEDGNKTEDTSKAKYITTDYLSKEQEKTSGSNLIEAFDSSKTSPDYKEVKAVFKVIALDSYEGIITNIAEISDDSDETGKEVEDTDSKPNNDDEKEDDIDVEHIKLSYFDLALRKFITAVNTTEITNRIPEFKIDENGNYVYEHTKEPVEVVNGDIVTYTLRIYNEGTKDGYAKEVKDDLPEGLEFLPENGTNKEYRWVMLDENGDATEDITKAVSIKTDYLSKEQEDETGRENLLEKFDAKTMEEPDYRDIKIAFKVTEPNTSDRILINKAQISDDSDKDGNEVIDKDSTPDKWIDNEDDQDIEKVKVKYFDLALRKWVTQAIVIDNGKQTVTETGHKAEDDPEEVVKVEIKEGRLNKVVVKFRYKIRITNEGEIAGYATEISDYIPTGLKFVQADNPNWKEVDGKIVTDQLKDTLLQPGESAEVEVLLTWINGKDNFGLKINVAEISKDKNESNTPDIDSTPNNEKPGEDDIDDAPVILTIKTGAGENIEYITLIASTLAILGTGVIFIKKYVL